MKKNMEYKNYKIECEAIIAINCLTQESDMFYIHINIIGPKSARGLAVCDDGKTPYHSRDLKTAIEYGISYAKNLIDKDK